MDIKLADPIIFDILAKANAAIKKSIKDIQRVAKTIEKIAKAIDLLAKVASSIT